MKNKIQDLRNHLFAALESLADKESPMDIDRAKAIAQVGQAIIDSARVENEFIKLSGSEQPVVGSAFLSITGVDGEPGKTVHRLKS